MSSMIIIFVSITSIIAINSEAVDVDSNTKWHNDHIKKLSGTLSSNKFQTMNVPEYYGLDIWTILRLQPRLDAVDPALTLPPTETITSEPFASQHDGGRRNRRQAKDSDKVKGEDYGSNSVVYLTSSGSPLNANGEDVYPKSVENWTLRQPKFVKMIQIRKFAFRNRRRRSASVADKNITPTEDPMISCNDPTMKAIQCALSHSVPVAIPTQCLRYLF